MKFIYVGGGPSFIHSCLEKCFWTPPQPSDAAGMSEVQFWSPENCHRGQGHSGAGWLNHRGGFPEAVSVALSLEE